MSFCSRVTILATMLIQRLEGRSTFSALPRHPVRGRHFPKHFFALLSGRGFGTSVAGHRIVFCSRATSRLHRCKCEVALQSPPKSAGKLVPREMCREVSNNFLDRILPFSPGRVCLAPPRTHDFKGFRSPQKGGKLVRCENCRQLFLTLFVDF